MVNRDGQTPRVFIPLDPSGEGISWVYAEKTGLARPYPLELTAPDGSRWKLVQHDEDGSYLFQREG
ncbi:hypothetical protein Asi02nite_80330 [Asanoa siamensis]|uniref:Uncharacterized protein n=1 Tax=Asanoa siamensis TaxID=926357 RepID=A0ABQ4D4Q2_9ACTN|nr:hypothetical protein Asi02nite_80330 [Asanoa siamensis]